MRSLTRLLSVLLLAACCACEPPRQPPPPGGDPPQVFLLLPETNVVGSSLAIKVSVNGCDGVRSLALYDRDTFLRNLAFSGNPTDISLTGSDLGALYPTLGLAADLALVVKATCDDGRSNQSQAAAARFFPVEKVWPGTEQLVPDVFYAEGGLGGASPTFIGCVGTSIGTALARVDVTGAILALNQSLPFACSLGSVVSDKNKATGKRWLLERGVGAFAFNANLEVTSQLLAPLFALGVTPDGDAIVWDDKAAHDAVKRVSHVGTAPANLKWGYQPPGILMGNPVMRPGPDTVLLPIFVDELGANRGKVVIETLDYATGAFAGGYDLKLINYPFGDTPPVPPGVISEDGAVLYFPLVVSAEASIVYACATNLSGCTGAGLRWQSPPLAGKVLATLPFAAGNQVAAIAAQRLHFLDAVNGTVLNPGAQPLLTPGSLVTLAAQPGRGQDFYVLNGPAGGFPTEVVAVDAAAKGEVYRYGLSGGGGTSASSMMISVDDAGQAWLRMGPNLVKPLPLAQYRAARSP